MSLQKLFTPEGKLREDLRDLAPKGEKRMSATHYANGGLLRRELKLPDLKSFAVSVKTPIQDEAENTRPLGLFLKVDN